VARYLAVVVVVWRLDVLLDQVVLHRNEQVACGTVGRLHFPHEVLHTDLCQMMRAQVIFMQTQFAGHKLTLV